MHIKGEDRYFSLYYLLHYIQNLFFDYTITFVNSLPAHTYIQMVNRNYAIV